SPAEKKALSFFRSTNIAAVSASAFSLRRSSFSNSFTRRASALSPRGVGRIPCATASRTSSRNRSKSASCSPSRRRHSPSPASPAAAAARTTRSFSSGVQRLFPLGFFLATTGTFASLSHFDNVGCPTPHSFDNAFALILDGPIIFATILALNFALCFTASSAFSPPGCFRSAQAATSLTQGATQRDLWLDPANYEVREDPTHGHVIVNVALERVQAERT